MDGFEILILKYLILPETKEGRQYIPEIEAKMLDYWEHQAILLSLQEYFGKYNRKPILDEFLEYTEKYMMRNDFQDEEIDKVLNIVESEVYTSINPEEIPYVKDIVIENAQYKLTKKLVTDLGGRLKEGVPVFRIFHNEMSNILKLGDIDGNTNIDKGTRMLTKGRSNRKLSEPRVSYPSNYKGIKIITTGFKGMDRILSAGGIYTPQFHVLMSGAKAFKTGFLVNLAVRLAKQGYKVFYADGENGLADIETRIMQNICECTVGEIIRDRFNVSPDDIMQGFLHDKSVGFVYRDLARKINKMTGGGDIVVHSYATGVSTIPDVEADLSELKTNEGFEPDIILYDAIEHFAPSKRQQTDVLDSQFVFKEAINLNKRINTACISPAQVQRAALNKEIFDIKDIGRDYGIIKYAHGVWAINRTMDEENAGVAQIFSVVQRGGDSKRVANYVKINASIMRAEEIESKEAKQIVADYLNLNV
jgi:hypothetical protein